MGDEMQGLMQKFHEQVQKNKINQQPHRSTACRRSRIRSRSRNPQGITPIVTTYSNPSPTRLASSQSLKITTAAA